MDLCSECRDELERAEEAGDGRVLFVEIGPSLACACERCGKLQVILESNGFSLLEIRARVAWRCLGELEAA